MSTQDPRNAQTSQAEIPLLGGIQPGRVVKVGDTVRRTGGAWSDTLHSLMRHVRAGGFPAPTPLGFDTEGREVLSFLPGRASNWPWPPALRETSGARKVGAFARAYHSAAAGFAPAQPVWRHGPQAMDVGEIALHGDFAPHNMVWDEDAPVGLIDFELARPGRPIEDAGFCVVRTACFRDDAKTAVMGFATPPDRRARLAAFAEGYGAAVVDLLTAARGSIIGEAERMQKLGGRGLEPWATFLRLGLAEEAAAELAWFEANVGRLA